MRPTSSPRHPAHAAAVHSWSTAFTSLRSTAIWKAKSCSWSGEVEEISERSPQATQCDVQFLWPFPSRAGRRVCEGHSSMVVRRAAERSQFAQTSRKTLRRRCRATARIPARTMISSAKAFPGTELVGVSSSPHPTKAHREPFATLPAKARRPYSASSNCSRLTPACSFDQSHVRFYDSKAVPMTQAR